MPAATPWVAATPIHLDGRVVGSALVPGAAGTGPAYEWNNNVAASHPAATGESSRVTR